MTITISWTGFLVFLCAVLAAALIWSLFFRKAGDTAAGRAAPEDEAALRGLLGIRIVKWSSIVLGAVALAVILSGMPYLFGDNPDPDKLVDNNQWVFASLLPLFGTWVGTVLAYFFSKENFKAASEASENLIRIAGQKLHDTPIFKAMIPFNKIIGPITVPAGGLGAIKCADIETAFSTLKLPNREPVSRLVLMTAERSCVAILHRATWTEMHKVAQQRKDSGGQPAPIDMANANLSEILAERTEIRPSMTFETYVTSLIAYVREAGNLAEAKARMESIQGTQDAIVTASGVQSDPIVGWITNVEITKVLEA